MSVTERIIETVELGRKLELSDDQVEAVIELVASLEQQDDVVDSRRCSRPGQGETTRIASEPIPSLERVVK